MPTNQTIEERAIDAPSALSPGQLARRWKKCRQTIYNMIDAGEIHSFKVRSSRLIPISEVERIESGASK